MMTSHQRHTPKAPIIIFVLLGVSTLGFFCLLIATKWGIGITGDSTVYIDSAKVLLTENRFFYYLNFSKCSTEAIPVTHYPPFYPFILSLMGRIQPNLWIDARYLNAFIFSLNIFLVGCILYIYTKKNSYITILGALFVLLSPVMLGIHTLALTDPLFISLALSGLFSLNFFLRTNKYPSLIGGAIILALAMLVRYVGITLVITGVLGILLLSRKRNLLKLLDSLILLLISLLPFVLFLFRNIYLTHSATDRNIKFQPLNIDHLTAFSTTISSWLFPGSDRFTLIPYQSLILNIILAIIVVGFINTIIIFLIRRRKKNQIKSSWQNLLLTTPAMFALFIVIYLSFLIVSITFFDSFTPFDNRILSPVFISLIIIILYLVNHIIRLLNHHFAKYMFISGLILFLIGYFVSAGFWVKYSYENGRGLNGRLWQYPEITQYLDNLPTDTLIYSNNISLVYILSGRYACSFPLLGSSPQNQIDDFINQLNKNYGQILYFNNKLPNTPRQAILEKQGELGEEDLNNTFSLKLIERERTGVIYQVVPTQ